MIIVTIPTTYTITTPHVIQIGTILLVSAMTVSFEGYRFTF